MKPPRLIGLILSLCALITLIPVSASIADDNEPAFFALSAGAFDVGKDDTTFEGRVEYRDNHKLWVFKPFAGLMATGDGGGYVYAGLLADIFWGRRFVTTLSLAPGAYYEGDGKDLGSVLEFRSQLELAYRFDNRARLAVSISHMSNASLGDRNPGEESIMLTYAHPIRGLFGD